LLVSHYIKPCRSQQAYLFTLTDAIQIPSCNEVAEKRRLLRLGFVLDRLKFDNEETEPFLSYLKLHKCCQTFFKQKAEVVSNHWKGVETCAMKRVRRRYSPLDH